MLVGGCLQFSKARRSFIPSAVLIGLTRITCSGLLSSFVFRSKNSTTFSRAEVLSCGAIPSSNSRQTISQPVFTAFLYKSVLIPGTKIKLFLGFE